jgi:hypothetical protein
MWVRNIPWNGDFDQDGIGDVCDNCIVMPNCSIYGSDEPAPHGVPLPLDDAGICQTDTDQDGIGDACIDPDTDMPIMLAGAAGPVGFGPDDDFDQDGLANASDWCPRIPVVQTSCILDTDCPNTATCSDTGLCNHPDADDDQVGDVCDTCAHVPNPLQVTDAGMQLDDQDRDFIGAVCEPSSACDGRSLARPIRFYDVSVEGSCCVATYPGDGQLHDPLGLPVSRTCSEADEQDGICRKLPASVLASPGMVELPLGCEQALADAGVGEATALTLADVGGDPIELWSHACRLAPLDHDFDGVGDSCDLCEFAFDPSNQPYTDDEGVLWPNDGAACNGEYADLAGAMCSG